MPANDREEMMAELESLPSIGPILAKRIYEDLHPSSIREVRHLASDRTLTTVEGIGPSRCNRIARSLNTESFNGDQTQHTGSEAANRRRFLETLRCPDCPESTLIPEHLSLRCDSCGGRYYEYRGVVDFTEGGSERVESPEPVNSIQRPGSGNMMRSLLTDLVSSRLITSPDFLTTKYLDLSSNSKLLDIGCGTGADLRRFARALRKSDGGTQSVIVGLDPSWTRLEEAQRSTAREGLQSWVSLVRNPVTDLPFRENMFSQVHLSSVLHRTEDTQAVTQNIARILEPDGILVLRTALLGRGMVTSLLKRAGEFVTDFHWFTREELFDVLTRTGFEIDTESIHGNAITLRARRI